MKSATTIDVGALLDDAGWSTYQKLLVVATASTIILDGLDNQLLGAAVPAMMREWALKAPAFVPVQTAGMIGMMIGGAIGGVIGDRLGRRIALIGSVITFGVLTVFVSLSSGIAMLTALRFFAGLGLGGAMPNAAALASEYVPRKQRPFAVTLTIVCIPLGGTLAALVAGRILPQYGWRALFVVGGLIPLVVAAVLFKLLPESPQYLATRRERWPELVALMRRFGHDVSAQSAFVSRGSGGEVRARGSIRELFAPQLRRDTLGLCGAFFFCLLAIYVGFSWIVAMLAAAGYTQVDASNALAAFNFGGVGGAIAGAILIQRLGSRVTLLGMSALAVITSLAMAGMALRPPLAFSLLAMFTVTGGLLNAVQTTMYALAANVYPTEVRATGVGTAVAVGRIGNVLASYVGAMALDTGGAAAFFTTWAMAMAVVFASLAVVRRHIARATN